MCPQQLHRYWTKKKEKKKRSVGLKHSRASSTIMSSRWYRQQNVRSNEQWNIIKLSGKSGKTTNKDFKIQLHVHFSKLKWRQQLYIADIVSSVLKNIRWQNYELSDRLVVFVLHSPGVFSASLGQQGECLSTALCCVGLCACVMLQDDICVSCRCSRGWTPADQAATSVHEWWRQWEWDWHRGWVRGCQEGEVVVLRAPSACQCSHCKKQCFIPPILAVVVLYSSSLGCSTLFLQSWL